MTHVVQFPGLGLTLTVNEVAFSIGNFQVRWYGVIIAVGFLLALVYASRSCKKMNINMDKLIDAVLVGLVGGIVCARLYYVFFDPNNSHYFEDPIEILKIWEGGLAIYGGVIGALVFGGLMAKARKLKVAAVLDLASLGFLIGQGVGRWGNFVNQEAFGSATNLPWGMYSDNTELVVPGSPVHPCFLYESLLCLLGFVLLHFFTRKLRRYDGQTFLLYIVWYGVCRFFIEGTRTDSLIIPYTSLRVSQVVALACVVVGVILLIVFRHKTSLTGCGDKRVMDAVGLIGVSEAPAEGGSTIFTDLPDFDEKEEISPAGEETIPSGEAESPKTEPQDAAPDEAETGRETEAQESPRDEK